MSKMKPFISKLLGKSEIIEQEVTNDISLSHVESDCFPTTNIKEEKDFEYFAFISYQSKDADFARWLQNQLEHYKLPSNIIQKDTRIPKEIRPIFRDESELNSGFLSLELSRALSSSKYLIVICSPNSANSPWVEKEVESFENSGRTENIIPVILSGCPYSGDNSECFVSELRKLRGTENELLAIDIQKYGKEVASVKIISRMLHLKFDLLWNRYEREKETERLKLIETNNKIRRNQARFVSEKVKDLVNDGDSYTARLVALEVLPHKNNADFPYTSEAESALRVANRNNTAILRGHNSCIFACDVNLEGNIIASGANDGVVKLWNAQTGNCITSFAPKEITKGITSVCFSADSKKLYIGGTNCVIEYSLLTEISQSNFLGHSKMISHITKSIDGKLLITSSYDKTIKVWDVETKECIKTLIGHESVIVMSDISKDGKWLVSVDLNGKVCIWDFHEGVILKELISNSIHSARFSSIGDKIVTCSYNGHIQVFDLECKELINIENDKNSSNKLKDVECAIFSTDNRYILSGDSQGRISIWDSNSGRLCDTLLGHFMPVDIICSILQDNFFVSASRDCTLRIWEPRLEKLAPMWIHKTMSKCFYLNKDTIIASSWDGTIKCYDRVSQKCAKEIIKIDHLITSISLSSNKKLLSSISSDNYIRIWDTNTWDLLYQHRTSGIENHASSFSRNTKSFVTTEDNKIYIKNTKSGIVERVLAGHESIVEWAEYSRSGLSIVSCSRDKSIIIWDANSGRIKNKLLGHTSNVNHAVFNNNGSLVASASDDFTVRIWDIEKSKEKLILRGHKHNVQFVAFSPDEKLIVSASNDIRIWDADTGVQLDCFSVHKDMVMSVCFNNTADRILSCSADGTFMETEFRPLSNIIEEISKRFQDRQLTEKEKNDYYL